VKIPLITTNRINTPEVAEDILASGCADMVSMARPFLADPDFVNKAAAGKATESTPVSAAIRPVWTTSSRASSPAAW
jgi:2,4-dienoyl-CoA reductase-like NADH-dependent reductase (Old Yellow Enzyme family)